MLPPLLHLFLLVSAIDQDDTTLPVKSGVGVWIDVDTPLYAHRKRSSRGRQWHLVMSDEFNLDNRTFHPGKDHLWTALDIPDGVNDALGWYSPDNVYTEHGSLVNRVDEEPRQATYYNQWLESPRFETRMTHYTSGMIQSWNKFCFQGGLMEVSVKLPGAVNPASWNPHVVHNLSAKEVVRDKRFFPTWPGIWLMGNLGRALFSGSTTRMWPWSYNECNKDLAAHQWINACNATPGYGLNPNQGRGAPEIDLLEGGGTGISSSIQIAPGMPVEYRTITPVTWWPYYDTNYCFYTKDCRTPGANIPDAPSLVYSPRGHLSWYQQLRYGSNPRCLFNASLTQTFEKILAARGNITSNTCNKNEMSASCDPHASLDWIDGRKERRWGVNTNGNCFATANGYKGAFVCDPDNRHAQCVQRRRQEANLTHQMPTFNYQIDALSANWDISFEAYTTFYRYSMEWFDSSNSMMSYVSCRVPGRRGYVRWMLDDQPIYEIPASSIENVPQGRSVVNPSKLMVEEPLYVIINIAVAKAWGLHSIIREKSESFVGTTPPNANIGPCRGNATHPPKNSDAWKLASNICDSFPMFMEIDYIRLYQNPNTMSIGCDPSSHPTKEWIDGHLSLYTDANNSHVVVSGQATCSHNDDCTIAGSFPSGRCVQRRCICIKGYGGPRCTKVIVNPINRDPNLLHGSFLALFCIAATTITHIMRKKRLLVAKNAMALQRTVNGEQSCDEISSEEEEFF